MQETHDNVNIEESLEDIEESSIEKKSLRKEKRKKPYTKRL